MGGGLSDQDETEVLIDGTSFLNNVAIFYGAGISAMFSTLRLSNIYAEENICEIEGGVVHRIYTETMVIDSQFKGNLAVTGGVIACNSNSTCLSERNYYVINRVPFS
jgi:hypothetical protein